MDRTQKKAGTIGVIRYWFKIIFPKVRRGICVYIKEHVALTLVIIIVAGVTSIFSANGILDKAISEGYTLDVSNLIRTLCAFAILSLLYIMWSVIFTQSKFITKRNKRSSL